MLLKTLVPIAGNPVIEKYSINFPIFPILVRLRKYVIKLAVLTRTGTESIADDHLKGHLKSKFTTNSIICKLS